MRTHLKAFALVLLAPQLILAQGVPTAGDQPPTVLSDAGKLVTRANLAVAPYPVEPPLQLREIARQPVEPGRGFRPVRQDPDSDGLLVYIHSKVADRAAIPGHLGAGIWSRTRKGELHLPV